MLDADQNSIADSCLHSPAALIPQKNQRSWQERRLGLYRIGTLLPVKRSAMGIGSSWHAVSYLRQPLKERGFPLLEFTIL